MAEAIATPSPATVAAVPAAAPSPAPAAPILSFPAILRNPGLTNRFAHLTGEDQDRKRQRSSRSVSGASAKKHRRENDGKRWVRRKDNAQFVGNPYIVTASRTDYVIPPPQTKATFPEPLPPYLPRTVKLPSTTPPPPTIPISANAGRFSLSLKGMRKELRKQGGRAEGLVVDIERAIVTWLVDGGTLLAPGANLVGPNAPRGEEVVPIGNNTSIEEVSRTPLQLIWRIPDDAFARYVVHCCARYHEIVSFSKGDANDRLTYLLRPNVTRPDRRQPAGLETPPATDFDYSSNPDVDTDSNIDSDFLSDRDFDSDAEGPATGANGRHVLDQILESPAPGSPTQLSPTDDTWSIVDEADVESSNEMEIEQGVQALSISSTIDEEGVAEGESEDDPDKTLTGICSVHRPYPTADARRRVMRSTSSPSRSPVRIRPAERRRVYGPAVPEGKRSFYEFVFR